MFYNGITMDIDVQTTIVPLRWEEGTLHLLDQRRLPEEEVYLACAAVEEVAEAIRTLAVRGALLIGIAAAYGMALGARLANDREALLAYADLLAGTRPTAVNLFWALDRMRRVARGSPRVPVADVKMRLVREAIAIRDEDAAMCRAIGEHGAALIREGMRPNTHCNAGWLACVDWGTALAPVYKAHDAGVAVHVWVDETRPRNQGASLTAYELGAHGVPCTVIADNAGGHLMQHGQVDAVIVGTDRTTRTGDVCNKIGTYLKALAARDNHVPFYVALPASTIDWQVSDGVAEIPIEARSAAEVTHIQGKGADGAITTVQLTPEGSAAFNPAFDVTPARLVTALITERGVAEASEAGLRGLYGEPGQP